MNRLPLILIIFFTTHAFAQRSDVIVLKKRNKTIDRFYSGKDIDFTTTSGAYVNANIQGIREDTLFLREFIVRTTPTQLGVYILDTVGVYNLQYHYNEIKVIGKSSKGFNVSGSAASLMGGGLLLMLASGVVYLVDKENFSPALLIASASLAGIGFLMAKTSGKGMEIGKKYHLVYLNLSDNKKP